MNQRASQRTSQQVPLPPTAQILEDALTMIPGVLCACVTMEGDTTVSEVHLVSSYAKKPKSLVRDAESLLHAQFHLQIDYRCISVVQIPTENDAPLSRRSLRYVSAGPSEGDSGLIEAVLALDESQFRGAVPAMDDSRESFALAAGQATLQAVQWAYELDLPLMVQESHVVASSFFPVCVSVIEASTKHGQELLTGTCFVFRDIYEAGAKSVLDAINRRVTYWVRAQTLATGG